MNAFICLQANIYIDIRFKMHSDSNIFKIKGFCFKVMYLMTNQILSSTFKLNFVLTKTLAYAPLKFQATKKFYLHDFRALLFSCKVDV